jgi:hypothetical protein
MDEEIKTGRMVRIPSRQRNINEGYYVPYTAIEKDSETTPGIRKGK